MAKIVIVDDSRPARLILRKILEEAGHEIVGEAADGDAAVTQYHALQPDLITMDINMPGTDGLAASQRIRGEFPRARIMMVSSVSASETVCRAVLAGVSAYLLKPFEREKVIETTNLVLQD